MENIYLDHADIVTTHTCNNKCKFCIDKFVNTDDRIVSLEDVEKFLKLIRKNSDRKLDVLLLGGEPTTLTAEQLISIANLVHKYNFEVAMSTNGINKEKIIDLIPHFDWIQVTVHSDSQIDFWRQWPDKINIKWSGDRLFTIDKLHHFVDYTKGFERRSVSMYFTPDWEELCIDKAVWKLLDTLNLKRNGSYYYAFYEGVRFNIIDEPTIPKLYPNGNYNKTWNHEELDDYLSNGKC